MTMMMKALLLAVCYLPAIALGFCPPQSRSSLSSSSFSRTTSSLSMAPRYDEQSRRWEPTNPEEGPEAGYDIWGTVLRHGPLPFYNRVFRSDGYEQGVLKFMANDEVDRNLAQAEMDSYLSNPNDWAYNRLNNNNVDYLTINTKQIALTLVWSVLIISLLSRGTYCAATGDNFWAIVGLTSKAAWCEADASCVFNDFNHATIIKTN